jgi:phosphoglycolate phosphatase-like HAD superfamily hydrolase
MTIAGVLFDKDGTLIDVNATWVDSWGKDSREGLPRLVKIALALRSPEGAEEDMTTIVAIRSATRD